jgi:alkanesulfonate monooxygenase SsuD/methylene tetrahydromethanopterin reductase-like flavin-dependent oxidoreductase (luciferase family)
MLRLVMQYADIWNNLLYGFESTPAEARRIDASDEACERHGRDPASLGRSLTVGVWCSGRLFSGERPITGSVAEMAEQIHQIADLGYGHIQVALTPRPGLETFARILEELHA